MMDVFLFFLLGSYRLDTMQFDIIGYSISVVRKAKKISGCVITLRSHFGNSLYIPLESANRSIDLIVLLFDGF